MAKYGSFKYSEEKYGDGSQSADLRWTFLVAWDGYYGGHGNEAERMTHLRVKRGRDRLLKADGTGFEPYRPGVATVTLDNSDGRYDPWNTSSDLYPDVSPGKFAYLKVYDNDTDTDYGIMYGTVEDIKLVRRGKTRQAVLTIMDGLEWLRGRLVETSVVTDDAKYTLVEQVVNDRGVFWPPSTWNPRIEWYWRIISSTDASVLNHKYWWAWQQNAWQAIKEFNDAEIAVLFHARAGRIAWYPRDYTYNASTTLAENEILQDITTTMPWENIKNDVRANVYTKTRDSGPYTLWTLDEVVPLLAGQSKTFDAKFRYEDWTPASNSFTVTYVVNTENDGTGDNITSDVEQSYGGDEGEKSEGVQIILKNTGTSDGFITSLYCSGVVIYPANVTGVSARDNDSVEDYGPKSLVFDSRWAEAVSQQQAIVNWLLDNLKDPQPSLVVQVEDRPGKQYYIDLYDKVTLTSATLGFSGGQDFRVGSIEHEWLNENGQSVRTTYHLEPYFYFDDVIFFGAHTTRDDVTAVPDETVTALTQNVTIFDTGNQLSGGAIVIDTAGYYRITTTTHANIAAIVGGNIGYYYLELTKNGTAQARFYNEEHDTAACYPFTMEYSITLYCAADDILRVRTYQDNPNDFAGEVYYTKLIATRIGA